MPDDILKKFPKTIIIVGDKDPLRDDSIFITKRMVDLKVDIFL